MKRRTFHLFTIQLWQRIQVDNAIPENGLFEILPNTILSKSYREGTFDSSGKYALKSGGK